MSLNFDHDLEYGPGQEYEFISSDQDLYSAQFVGQPGALESIVDPCPFNFADFIHFPDESNEDESSFDTSSVPRTTGETRMDRIYDETEAMLTLPTDAAMLWLFSDTFNHVDADSQLFAADGLSNSQPSVDIFSGSAFAPSNRVQPADHLIPELSTSLSSSGSKDADHKRCVPRVRSFQCHTCAQIFSSQARLSSHKRQTHAPRRFSCACGSMFHMRKDLIRHEVTHNGGPRDFACTCGKDYLRHDHLLRHISNMDKKYDSGYHEAIIALP
jgi:hypothetical protein